MNISTRQFIDRVSKIHNGKYDYSLVEYVNRDKKIDIICSIHKKFSQTPHNHLNNHGCPKCAIELKAKKRSLSRDEFIEKANKIHKNKYLYDKVEYINNRTKVVVTCVLHHDFKITPDHHLTGTGCARCSNIYKRTTDEFITECSVIHNNKYDYSLVEYKSFTSKVRIICPAHGEFSQTPSHHLFSKCGCPLCNESKGEKKITYYLKNNNIQYVRQHKFKECRNIKPLSFDFYLPQYNICIEFDGKQHYTPNKYFGGHDAYLKQKKRDNIKDDFCNKNGIKLFRINHNDNVETKLNELFK